MERKSAFFFLLVFFICFHASASDVEFIYTGSRNYSLVERTDLRRYDNGKYVGLMSREIRSFIVCENGLYDGDFYVSQDTVHNQRVVVQGIHDSIRSVFKISQEGTLTMLEDNGYPSFRGFPTFSKNKIQIGQSWNAEAVRCADPLNKGKPVRMNIFVQYTYLHDEIFRGEEVFVLSAKWATRYGGKYIDENGDPDLQKATGSHNATLYIRKADCAALVIRDSVDETFVYADKNQYTFKGTISLFTEYPPAVDREVLIPALKKAELIDKDGAEYPADAGGSTANPPSDTKIRIEKTKGGIKLIITNLHFKADLPELLPGEESLLEKIASVLRQTPENKILIEGHTAGTGNPRGEMQLSLERAKTVAQALSERGVNADRFICRGSGSSKPVSDNSTPQGMAQNRRVEITILE